MSQCQLVWAYISAKVPLCYVTNGYITKFLKKAKCLVHKETEEKTPISPR